MSGQPTDNPYAAPQAELQHSGLPRALPAQRADARRGKRNSVFAWILMFCFNLPVGAYFGIGLSSGLGALGIIVAVVVLLVATTYYFSRMGRFANCWFAGSICVAASQFVPYLHIGLGYFAVSQFGLERGDLNFYQALICTLIVGGGLLGVSLVLAGFFYMVAYWGWT